MGGAGTRTRWTRRSRSVAIGILSALLIAAAFGVKPAQPQASAQPGRSDATSHTVAAISAPPPAPTQAPRALATRVAARPVATVLVQDGFEHGTLAPVWTANNGGSTTNQLFLDSQVQHSGNSSLAVVKAPGGPGNDYASVHFNDPVRTVYARAYVLLSPLTGYGALGVLQLDTATNGFLGSLLVVGQQWANTPPALEWYNGGQYIEHDCGPAPTPNTWHSIEVLDTLETDYAGSFSIWIDGQQVCSANHISTARQRNTRAATLKVGSAGSDGTVGMTVHIDDVLVSTLRRTP